MPVTARQQAAIERLQSKMMAEASVADELRVAEVIACHGGLADNENVYLLDGGIAITTGDQDDALSWDISRPLAEQMVEDANGSPGYVPGDGPSEDRL